MRLIAFKALPLDKNFIKTQVFETKLNAKFIDYF